jgi:hypothetical protein
VTAVEPHADTPAHVESECDVVWPGIHLSTFWMNRRHLEGMTLKVEVANLSEMLQLFFHTARRHVSVRGRLCSYFYEVFKCRKAPYILYVCAAC